MALFKLKIGYARSSEEDTLEVEAGSYAEARERCEKIVEDSREESERLAKRNVYTSRVANSCRICRRDFKTEMSAVEEMFKSLKN